MAMHEVSNKLFNIIWKCVNLTMKAYNLGSYTKHDYNVTPLRNSDSSEQNYTLLLSSTKVPDHMMSPLDHSWQQLHYIMFDRIVIYKRYSIWSIMAIKLRKWRWRETPLWNPWVMTEGDIVSGLLIDTASPGQCCTFQRFWSQLPPRQTVHNLRKNAHAV
jgi:hypothetical protein